MTPQITLAYTRHQLNWWDNFNTDLLVKVLEAKEKQQPKRNKNVFRKQPNK